MLSKPVKATGTLLSVLATSFLAAPAAHSAPPTSTLAPRLHEPATSPSVKDQHVACNETSLVEAINRANAAGGGTLSLSPRCTYTLTTAHGGGDDGLPQITTPITIRGRNATITRSASAPSFRILHVSPAGNLTLETTTISHGAAVDAAGIVNFGVLTVRGSTIRDNTATRVGGGIVSTGSLSVVSSVIRHNSAQFGGGINTQQGASVAHISNTAISHNAATGTGGGIVNAFGSRLTVTSSTINENSADDAGGGIDNEGSTFSCSKCRLTGNRATNQGGGIRNVGPGASASFTLSVISRNRAGDGGGIFEAGLSVTLTGTIVTADRPNNCAPANSIANCTG